MSVTLKPTARGLLRRQVLAELSGIGDIYIAANANQWGTALALRRRYEDCMRLLDDLGWREDDPAEEFAITMEPVPLMRVLARLHERCGEEVEEHVASTAEGRQALWEAMLTVAVCGDVLVDLVGDDVEEAMLSYRREREADGAEEAS
jgi:hypothetical protein